MFNIQERKEQEGKIKKKTSNVTKETKLKIETKSKL